MSLCVLREGVSKKRRRHISPPLAHVCVWPLLRGARARVLVFHAMNDAVCTRGC